MKQRLISSEAIIKQVQSENDNIKQKNIALINECKCLHDKEAQYTKLIAQHNSVIERLNNEMQLLRSEIKSLEDTNCMLVDKIKNENEVNRNERNAFITKSQIQIDELHTQLNAVHNELKTKNEVIKELQSRIESINKQNKNEMQAITNKNAEVVSKYSKDIKELSGQKEALVSKHREEIDRITFQHTIQINEMQLKLDSQISELKLDNIHLNERIDVYDSKINSCVAMFDDVVSGIKELSDSLLIKQSNNDNNNGNSGDDSNSSSSNVAKLKSSILTKLIAIQSKNTSFKNELRNIIITKPNNDNSLNSTAITAISKNSVKKLLPCTNGGSSSSRYTSTTLKRNPIKTTTTTTTINSVNTSRRSPFLRKSISQKIIITANNKK
jgi:chromosome segregation ATPase